MPVLCAIVAGALDAQVAEGNRLWEAGKLDAAKVAYERALEEDATSVRALYRLAVLASWGNRLDSALALAARARAVEPGDADVRLLQAQLRSWKGDLSAAAAAYDSVIAEHPARADAHAGLARVYHWQGRTEMAMLALARARAIDSTSAEIRTLSAEVRREARSTLDVSAGWNSDTDENTNWWQLISLSAPIAERVRITGTAGAQESSDPVRDARRFLAELKLQASTGHFTLDAAGGARRLLPEGGASRTEATYRAGITGRSRGVSAGLTFAHLPFDETAQLIGSGLDLDVLEGALDVTIRNGLVLGLGGGGASVSDDNDRYAVMASLTQTVGRFFVGTYGRQMGYDFRGTGYFSPGRFRLAETRAGWTQGSLQWNARVSGGLGLQQAFEGAEVQAEWHAEVLVGRRWDVGMVEAFGGVTNSLERSATGAYRSGQAGVRLVLGL